MLRGDHKDTRGTGPTRTLSGHVDDWENLAVDFTDGRLDPQTTAAIESHLEGCAACAARLRTQSTVLAFLRETPLEEAPADLENRVLDAVLFPPPARAPLRERAEEPSRWSVMWRRKIRPWVPATVGVAAVLLAVVSYGLLRTNGDEVAQYEATTSVALSNADVLADSREGEEAAGATAPKAATTAAPATTVAQYAAETTTTVPGALTTTATDALTTAAPETTSIEVAAAATQDRTTMIASLEEADVPAYFTFDATALADEDSAKKAFAAIVEQFVALTGLQPLDSTLALDGPTFAAFVPRANAQQLVDLLRSIGASVQLPVSLGMAPPEEVAAIASRLVQNKRDLPELSAYRTPKPAVSDWSFTTSTLAQSDGGAGAGADVPPDEAGTHVLVVIYLMD